MKSISPSFAQEFEGILQNIFEIISLKSGLLAPK